MDRLRQLSPALRQYLLITANYWAFTLTDGALRMLVVLYFHRLGYGALAIAMLFLFYEFFGVVTNLVGGWLGARIGLNRTMNLGMGMQILALGMLLVPVAWLTVPWVMAAQALSGIAKDLNKMSAKSAIKTLVPEEAGQAGLFKYVALLTGSKNALKGVGFFIGGALLSLADFRGAVFILLLMLALVWLDSLKGLNRELGKAKNKPKFKDIFSKSWAVNILSAARLCLFAARDVWFVVALPVYLASQFGWDHWQVGGFLASWIIGYGLVQTLAPRLMGSTPGRGSALLWAGLLALLPAAIAFGLQDQAHQSLWLLGGLLLFGLVFAVNSSLHSFLIVSYAKEDGVSLDVGFYYMANAMGRLLGTVLSGWIFQVYGLAACLLLSSALLLLTTAISLFLPREHGVQV
ncbi:organoarsenical effux MFS transporter ArsJ [Shewanella sedimentimangrovi]|uniref:Organoarsenical effux MFS transporter ArsJ n=1 Tax=Shewanella sedimentimangrovi TaxID=2814293 RepID=A0ABX7QZ36_9GAMM|nr:organoarsenical effux MFS transporter ArsJ [Shewanella sedimentimangrovi]QSX36807.1 organoarsenical effux MFS transporter ArsJ [Shewanella sedimentimangrovi]